MDGGVKQEEMSRRIKCEVRQKGPRRREQRGVHRSGEHVFVSNRDPGAIAASYDGTHRDLAVSQADLLPPLPNAYRAGTDPLITDDCSMTTSGWSNHVLLMFYLDNVFPFLFPLYRPSIHLEGGRAWLLAMYSKAPAIRQAMLCQSSLFFSLTKGSTDLNKLWETIMVHTGDAFALLRRAIQARLDSHDLLAIPHCTARLLAAIMQLQRFEIAVLSFKNCQQHLNAALDLFLRLLHGSSAIEQATPKSRFNAIIRSLKPSPHSFAAVPLESSSAEQAAFRFSSALLVLDDIIASTVLQEPPRLLEYHPSLLMDSNGADAALNLETIVGCQNWVFVELGKIAALDAWKQRCSKAGNLDVIELARQAMIIRDSLEGRLSRFNTDPHAISDMTHATADVFTTDSMERFIRVVGRVSVVTRVWAHAAMIYLFTVVSGWQPANPDVRYHVDRVIGLLAHQLVPPALLRMVVWPFCVAGCLAEPAQEGQIREMVQIPRPSCVFGTVNKALEIMESVWGSRNSMGAASRDLATCLRSQGELVLLV
jgi:hypothetical protein